MTNPLVECIPNFSDARCPEVIDAIEDAIRGVPDVFILNRQSDDDHNRSVITFIGLPAAVEEAAYAAIAKAAELIDLDQHTGEHPRLGATDVVPFVPIRDVTMQECIEMARRVGKRVGETLHIPVYLYEEAATTPGRVNLENIRRGEYEKLKEEIAENPARKPDFGPSSVGPAGATVIGARQPLIAYNVYLDTDDLAVAQKIARAVRHSSGGLRFVKALGMLVDGRAQVSMNLTNYRKTSVARVVEMIRREASRYGKSIHHSELIGMIPQAALIDAAAWYLQLSQFEPDQVLEQQVQAKLAERPMQEEAVEKRFQDELASATPTPGGGSAAAHTGANGAALVAMVARLTTGKKKYADVQEQMWKILERAEELRQLLNDAVVEDADAFDSLMAAIKMSKGTEEEIAARAQCMQEATFLAAGVPLKVTAYAVEVLDLAVQVAGSGNLNAISDAGSAAAHARAALTAAGLNVRINLLGMEEDADAQSMLKTLHTHEKKALDLETQMKTVLIERGGFNLG